MRKLSLPRRIITRFFAAFCLFLVALLLCASPIISHSARTMEAQNLQVYQDTLSHNLGLVNSQLQTLQTQLLFFGESNVDFQKLCREEAIDYVALRDTHSALQQMLTDSSRARDVVVVTKNNRIITRRQMVVDRLGLIDHFFNKMLVMPNVHSLDDFHELAKQQAISLPVFSEGYGQYDALIFFQPILNKYAQPAATAMIAVDIADILSAIAPDGILQTSNIHIYWKNEFVCQLENAETRSSLTALAIHSDIPGLSFSFDIPSHLINAGVQNVLYTMWALVFAALVGGLLLILFFLVRMGNPLGDLVQKVSALVPEVHSNNEYELISTVMEKLNAALNQQGEELDMQRKALKNSFLERALLGNITSQRTKKDFMALFPDFPQHYHLALLHMAFNQHISNEHTMNLALSKQLIIEQLLARQFSQPLYHFPVTPNLTAIILPDSAGGIDAIENLHAAFVKEYHLPMNIYVVHSDNGADGLSEAYAHAKRILRLAAGYIEKRVWSIGNFPKQENLSGTDYSLFQQFYEAVKQGETEAAVRFLHQIHVNLRDQSSPEEVLSAQPYRRTLQFLHSILIRIKQEHFEDLCAIQLFSPDLDQPLAAYFACLEEYTFTLSEALLVIKRSPTTFGADIVAYVDQHFTDPDFYQKTVSDYFNISEKALQSAVRSATQLSFAEYLEKKRLDLAHQLLLKTDLNVKDIAQQAGFALYNTFYKAFKRRWNCAPSEYRLQYNANQPDE